MTTLNVSTTAHTELVPITDQVRTVIRDSGIDKGVCTVYCPHTTGAITINKNDDPDVARDILLAVDKLIPQNDPDYRHAEGNSAAHVKACFFGASDQILVHDGDLVLGIWQGIYFCEFDGPRQRNVHVDVTPH